MRATVLLAGATFGPEALKVICKAFDEAWAEIRHHFGNDQLSSAVGRLKLANAILSVANDASRDVQELKTRGLEAMALQCHIDHTVDARLGRRRRTPKYWKDYSEEMLTVADRMADPECRRMLIGISEAYAQLALQRVEAEATRAALQQTSRS